MKKIIEKHEMLFSISMIIIYILTNSYCMQNFTLTSYKTFLVNIVLTLIIIIIILTSKLTKYYCLNRFPNPKKYIYFIPLLIIISVNLWNGFNLNNTPIEIIFYILSMLCIGFLEEIIFRGFLYQMMAKDSEMSAIIVTSLTFGIGHIINIFNGADLIPTLFQVCYAISIGFLFVTILRKSKSLWPCIITHSLTNALSIFNIDNNISLYVIPIVLIIVPMLYSIYIIKKVN